MSKKKYMVMIAACVLAASVFSQNIELPEVTTVISGDTEKVGEEALPDFEDVLRLPNGSGDVNPELPEVDASDSAAIATP